MLVGCGHRLAVYDIGEGRMDWQRCQAGILASWNRKTMSFKKSHRGYEPAGTAA